MAFYGMSFIFNGISCEELGLALLDFESTAQENGTIGTTVEISEDRIWGNPNPIHYNTSEHDPLEFKLVCAVSDERRRLDRYDIAKIAGWLKTPQYQYLQIIQPDLEEVRYKCLVKELAPVQLGGEIIGLQISFICDGPYGYLYPEDATYYVSGSKTISYRNKSNVNRNYFPVFKFECNSTDLTIVNESDGNRKTSFLGMPGGNKTITIDGRTGIVSAVDGADIYQYFNFVFPRLIRGENRILVTGNCNMTIHSEFPYDIGC